MVFLHNQIVAESNVKGQVRELIPINFVLPMESVEGEENLKITDDREYQVISAKGTISQMVTH